MAPELESSDVVNSDMPKRSRRMLLLSERYVCIYRVWYYPLVSGIHWGGLELYP